MNRSPGWHASIETDPCTHLDVIVEQSRPVNNLFCVGLQDVSAQNLLLAGGFPEGLVFECCHVFAAPVIVPWVVAWVEMEQSCMGLQMDEEEKRRKGRSVARSLQLQPDSMDE